ncbi:MAG TPA: primosomal protein N' [Polyangiaceae bacterium]|nr:primosomal protein N' [Polyangiaceae bacterium]
MLFARVAVPVPLGQAFTYTVTEELAGQVRRGARVLCEFGRRNVLGVVLEVGSAPPDVALEKLKPLRAVVDAEPVLSEELLGFLQELARYYLAPIGEVVQLALPAVERTRARALGAAGGGGRMVGRSVQVARATASAAPGLRGNAPELLAFLLQAGPTPLSVLQERWKSARSIVRRLAGEALVVVEEVEAERDVFFAQPCVPDVPPELTAPQAAAVAAICARLDDNARRAFLLDGITASGKTEVYLKSVERCLALGRGAIVLVPEIALTPQLVTRFRARLGDSIAVLHSGLGDADRHAMWKALHSGKLRVVVGARSALFAPVPNLGLLCVDEEHDGSFKQEEGVRYNARDMALLRAHRASAVCVLGSATPSISSLALVEQGRLEWLKLPGRARTASRLPEVEIVDLRRTGAGPGGQPLLSLRLYRELERVLADEQQAILFLNRRGFSPSLICDDCGHIAECPHCSVALTLHRSSGDRLRCHYCDYDCARLALCDKCRGARLLEEGAGTERIESVLAEAFPKARVARLDRDVAAGAKSAHVLERMHKREIDILVGTQMVTKGHDLPHVTLVGVLNADAALSLPDFRAAERSFHLFVQVAGRAGRGDAPGRVLIQTRQPEHPAIACAARHDVQGFVAQEIEARRELGYPPFSRMALVRCDAVELAVAEQAAEMLARTARRAAPSDVVVLGPAPAPLARLRNRYRFQLLLRAPERAGLRQSLLSVARAEVDRRVRVAIDVDPVSML